MSGRRRIANGNVRETNGSVGDSEDDSDDDLLIDHSYDDDDDDDLLNSAADEISDFNVKQNEEKRSVSKVNHADDEF